MLYPYFSPHLQVGPEFVRMLMLCPHFCPYITGCVLFLSAYYRLYPYVRISHVVSVFMSAYYRLCPYFCPHITGCTHMSARILDVVSVFLFSYYRLHPCLSAYYKLFSFSIRTPQFASVCLSAHYRLQSSLSGYNRYCLMCPHISGFALVKGPDNQRHC
jgi:hypothetical protein